jgi:CubicO group peptidase (beta-lactamase class C family)
MHWRPLLCLFALTIALHATRQTNRPTEGEALAALERELERAAAADEFSGTVIVAKHGVPIFERAYGRADREQNVPNTLATSFNVGSINKMMTAVAIIRLVQDGRLAVTDTVGKRIPGYPNRAIADHVTIHHLLTHTGGTGDIFDDDYLDYRLTLKTHDDYLAKFGARGPVHAPGAEWRYSNYGFVLLGAIIERATGKTYYEAIDELVLTPAKMASTSWPRYDETIGAIGYTKMRTGELEPNPFILPYRGMAAGGGWSSTADLLAFANALGEHALLDENHTKLVTTGKVRVRMGGFKYAYGFVDYNVRGVRCIGHNGGFPGANGDLAICENGYTVSVLANFDPPAAGRISQFVLTRLPK